MREITVRFTDDLDRHELGARNEAEQVMTFALDHRIYEIDLTEKNADELAGTLARWIVAARPAERLHRRQPAGAEPDVPKSGMAEARAYNRGLREWAIANGRGTEIHTGRGKKLYIPKQLRADYKQYLATTAHMAGWQRGDMDHKGESA